MRPVRRRHQRRVPRPLPAPVRLPEHKRRVAPLLESLISSSSVAARGCQQELFGGARGFGGGGGGGEQRSQGRRVKVSDQRPSAVLPFRLDRGAALVGAAAHERLERGAHWVVVLVWVLGGERVFVFSGRGATTAAQERRGGDWSGGDGRGRAARGRSGGGIKMKRLSIPDLRATHARAHFISLLAFEKKTSARAHQRPWLPLRPTTAADATPTRRRRRRHRHRAPRPRRPQQQQQHQQQQTRARLWPSSTRRARASTSSRRR